MSAAEEPPTAEAQQEEAQLLDEIDSHVLITPYAIQGYGEQHLDRAWQQRRLELFRDFCAPSVLNQSVQDFTWYLGVDARIAEDLQSQLKTATKGFGTLLPIGEEGWVSAIAAAMTKHGPRLLSSRLDSDDAIASNFMQTARQHAQPGCVLNFLDGAKYSTETRRATRLRMTSNHFTSYSSLEGSSVIQLGGHLELGRVANIRNLSTRAPMWLEVIHGGNVVNSWTDLKRPISTSTLKSQGLLQHNVEDSGAIDLVGHTARWIAAGTSHVFRSPSALISRIRHPLR